MPEPSRSDLSARTWLCAFAGLLLAAVVPAYACSPVWKDGRITPFGREASESRVANASEVFVATVTSVERDCYGTDCRDVDRPLMTYKLIEVIKGSPADTGTVRLRNVCAEPHFVCGRKTCESAPATGSNQLIFVAWGTGDAREGTIAAAGPDHVRELKLIANQSLTPKP